MPYWAAARLQLHRESLALNFLKVRGFDTFLLRIRECRMVRGRRLMITPPLFPGYAFIGIELQWHAARWTPGVSSLVMDGERPARVPDADIAELRARERDGFVVLPKQPAPKSSLHPGDRLRVRNGPFTGSFGLCAGMAPRDRVLVLLQMLGAERKVAFPRGDIGVAP
jgi:transcriptional antiterminator RfaH